MGIAISDDQDQSSWSYQLTFTAEPRGRHRPILRREVVERDGQTVLSRPTEEDKEDPERMTQTYLEQVNANREFRAIVEYLGSIRYLHLVPQLIRDPDRGGDRSDDPYGADFLLRMAKTAKKTRTRRLRRIGQSLKAAVPQLDQLDLVQDEIGHWHLQARYEHWRHTPARQNERDFSDGKYTTFRIASRPHDGRVLCGRGRYGRSRCRKTDSTRLPPAGRRPGRRRRAPAPALLPPIACH